MESSERKLGWKVTTTPLPSETRFLILVMKVKNSCGRVSTVKTLKLSMAIASYLSFFTSRKFAMTLRKKELRNLLHLPPSTCRG